jgi:hypothetical protein
MIRGVKFDIAPEQLPSGTAGWTGERPQLDVHVDGTAIPTRLDGGGKAIRIPAAGGPETRAKSPFYPTSRR